MARITVDDCLRNIGNRFELVIAAATRARELENENAEPKVPRNKDKPTVIALREISENKIDLTSLFGDYEFVSTSSQASEASKNKSSHPEMGEAGEVV